MANTVVEGVGGTSTGVRASCVGLAMSSCLEGEKSDVNVVALMMSKVTARLPSRTIARARWPHLESFQLADPEYEQPGEIDVLSSTIFGWIVTRRAV